MMKKLLMIVAICLSPALVHAFSPVRYVQISTNTLNQQSGSFNVSGGIISTATIATAAISTTTISSATIQNLTVVNQITLSTATITTLTVSSSTVTNESVTTLILSSGTATRFVVTTSTITTLNAQTVTASTLTPTVGIAGLTTGVAGPSGDYGEFISSTAVSVGTTIPTSAANFLTLSIPAGNWLVCGQVGIVGGGANAQFDMAVSSVSASTIGTVFGLTHITPAQNSNNAAGYLCTTLYTNTTVNRYLVVYEPTNTSIGFGMIYALRIQ